MSRERREVHAMLGPTKDYRDFLPLPWLDGWHAHRLDGAHGRNPYNVFAQYTSHREWSLGYTSRRGMTDGSAGPATQIKYDRALKEIDEYRSDGFLPHLPY